MKWKQKARIQNLIARLPASLSYAAYYFIQRRFGGLRSDTPLSRLQAGIKIAQFIRQHGRDLRSSTVLEIGTGTQINLPLALWLAGASRIVTVDLHPYLKSELVFDDIVYMRRNRQEVETLFEATESPGVAERLSQLIGASEDLHSILALTNIQYLAPADAARLDLEAHSIDYHVSYTTLEHIPAGALDDILEEGKRLLKQGGLFIHCIDFSDHFSHTDTSISTVNFLQFNEEQWHRWAGNRYMYHNRLRVDDFERLFASAGLKIAALEPKINDRALEALRRGFPLDPRFRGKSAETNATANAWIVASQEGAV